MPVVAGKKRLRLNYGKYLGSLAVGWKIAARTQKRFVLIRSCANRLLLLVYDTI